jgi:DNA-binding GntR family transcriptional regulator
MRAMSNTEIFGALEARLRQGDWLPGDQISEAALMQEFGVSRTPVRDALLRMHALDYLAIYPRKGIFVARLTVRQVLEQLEVLGHLEGLCAQLAAQRMTEAQRKRMERLFDETEDRLALADRAAYAQANQDFHDLLYEACCSDYLVRQILQIRTRTAAYRMRRFESEAGFRRSLAEHQQIAQAIANGEGAQAYQAALAHITMGGSEFAELVRQVPDVLFAAPLERAPNARQALTLWTFRKGAHGDAPCHWKEET